MRTHVVAALTATATAAVLLPATALAASPAAFTTDATGTTVNKNHYDNPCDVYLNGGPTGAALPTGSYTFAVLAPGGQARPNDPATLLSTDSNADRTFTSTSGTISYSGPHSKSTDTQTNNVLINLCNYAKTSNPGGVYILAICPTSNMTPSGCKYDAFKVRSDSTNPTNPDGDDLVATKTAAGAFRRTFSWSLTKAVNKTRVETNASTATFSYTVDVTKGTPVESDFVVSGNIQVFNINENAVTGVDVRDAIGATDCDVTGGANTIAGGQSETFAYTCKLSEATADTTGTNVATITWDRTSITSANESTTAEAPFDFSAAPQTVNDCTTVTDTIAGTPESTLGTTCAAGTTRYPYNRTLAVPSRGCSAYTNTAVESATQSQDSKTVTVCRTNSDGFTIGYWQNKNGQDKIAKAASPLCSNLAAFRTVLTDLPSSCNSKTLPGYVFDVIKLANAAGDGAPMFKAQFLATALNVYFSPSLGATGVVVPTAIASSGCMTVSNLLAYGNQNYSTLSTGDKTFFMTVKSLYDSINNNVALTC